MSFHSQTSQPKLGNTSRSPQVTVQSLLRKKQQGEKLVTLTCYDYTTAKILDQAGVDLLLVGDSLAMTVLGHADTLSVTMDEMLHHTKAVSRGCERALVVGDMPFMSYQIDHARAIENAGRFLQEGRAHAVKLEGASPFMVSVIDHLVQAGIPVIGHLGFTPQSVNTLGGFKIQGKTIEDAQKILNDALLLQSAGVGALVLEMVPHPVASIISQRLTIPTIGIGSGNGCDGQILVIDDLLGRYQDLKPRFVRQYLNSVDLVTHAVQQYQTDIQDGRYPDNELEAYPFPVKAFDKAPELLFQALSLGHEAEEPAAFYD